jgi:formylglycine-generating enzyme required for sulfatase activity
MGEVRPSAYLTWFQAQAACAASGKHLITNAEWQAAVIGTRDPGASDGTGGACLTSVSSPREAGLGTACVSYRGAEDMIGNFWEWTSDWYGQGADGDDGSQPMEYFGDGYWNVDAAHHQGEYGAHFPSGGFRGGAYNNSTQSGVFALYLRNAPSISAADQSFRCARGF